jgi:transglutaminase-like putative cysteine protease
VELVLLLTGTLVPDNGGMQRYVAARIVVDVGRPATIALQIAAAANHDIAESLTVTVDGRQVSSRCVMTDQSGRIHVVDATPGELLVQYSARVLGPAVPLVTSEADLLRYLRPSRYSESDSLAPTARAEFAGLAGADLLAAVSSWVGTRLSYVPGSSLPTDGAVATLLARQGVCRDYAHLVVALLRSLDVPARLAAVYAPGLNPMDFHAVAEAYVDGDWYVVDATTLAPRGSLLRISTGRDASDTAFMSSYHGLATLRDVEVLAVVGALPCDDVHQLTALA